MTVVPKGYFYYCFFWVGKTPFFPHCRNKMVENYSPIASSLLWNSFDETPNNPLIGLKQKPWLFKIPYQRIVTFHKWDLNFVRFSWRSIKLIFLICFIEKNVLLISCRKFSTCVRFSKVVFNHTSWPSIIFYHNNRS